MISSGDSRIPRGSILVSVVLVICALPSSGEARGEKKHPRLVSAKTARCETCHEAILKGKASVHPPVADDCTMCHELLISKEEGTVITLVDEDPALCLMCHDDKEAAANLELAGSHAAMGDGCLTCHDPHATDYAPLLEAPVPGLCSNCHDLEELDPAHGGQLTTATNCAACHSPHGSEYATILWSSNFHAPFEDGACESCHREPFGKRIRLRARGERLCEACHGEIAEEGAMSVHAALQGASRADNGCLSCHDPHLSPNRSLLEEAGPALCASCHREIVAGATAPTGHPPAADDCTSCHQPHSSSNAMLLTSPRESLCSECHDLEASDLIASHLGAPLATLDCLTCHSPHGAGNEKLLAATLHPPVLEGCDTCHTGRFDELEENGKSALCTMCHSEIEDIVSGSPRPHAALEMAACTVCHNPHASPQPKLIKAADGKACFECHSDIAPVDGEQLHGVIAVLGCEACHEPHGGENEKLLRVTGSELCLSCHEVARIDIPKDAESIEVGGRSIPARVAARMASLRLSPDGERNHPTANHRVLGLPSPERMKASGVESSFEGELTCLTCHDPHKGKGRGLFRWGASSTLEVCMQCHQK